MATQAARSPGDGGWWGRNAAELQTVTTLALIMVTGVYAEITRRILRSQERSTEASERQAMASEAQLGNMTTEFEAERRHADRLYEETLRSRLDSGTSPVTVEVGSGRFTMQGTGTSGSADADIEVRVTVVNHGPAPAILTTVGAERATFSPNLMGEILLAPKESRSGYWTLRRAWAEWTAPEGATLEPLALEVTSPVTRVVDLYLWVGVVNVPPGDPPQPGVLSDAEIAGTRVILPRRSYPAVS